MMNRCNSLFFRATSCARVMSRKRRSPKTEGRDGQGSQSMDGATAQQSPACSMSYSGLCTRDSCTCETGIVPIPRVFGWHLGWPGRRYVLLATPHHLDGIDVVRLPVRSRKRHHSSKGDASRRKGGGREGKRPRPLAPLMYIASAERAGKTGRHGMFPLHLRRKKGNGRDTRAIHV